MRTIEISSITITGKSISTSEYQTLMERLHEVALEFCDELAAGERAQLLEEFAEEMAERGIADTPDAAAH